MSGIDGFISRWSSSGASERANYQLFLTELCEQVLGVDRPNPASDTTSENAYTFERHVTLAGGFSGFIDLYKRDSFVLEAKQGSDVRERTEAELLGISSPVRKSGLARRGTRSWERAMQNAKEQARRYARALPTSEGWPPFLIVVDVGHCIDLYADFSRQGKTYVQFPDAQTYRIALDDLRDESKRELLRKVWTDPLSLDPSRRSAKVTRELAAKLAKLAASMEGKGHEPERVAHFLMRCLFSMFAEDVGLLPKRAFTGVLEDYRNDVELLREALEHVWATMDSGGFSPALKAKIPQFNGDLFRDSSALPLTEAQAELLLQAARSDWADVEPAIFGTLLERALDPVERHKLGAHFTPRAYVERLVLPTIIEPLREEFTAVQAAATALEAEGKLDAAREELRRFHRRLCTVRVLDPACGSGNFLYVTLEHLKRLEGEVVTALSDYGDAQGVLGSSEALHEMTEGRTVTPGQLLGIEINPRAAAIADVVLWIGYLQWHLRTYGDASSLHAPILRRYHNIEHRDALIEYDERRPRIGEDGEVFTRWDGRSMRPHPATGQLVPDETKRTPIYRYINSRRAEWPTAEFILGNPPFIGAKDMRQSLGDGYTEAVREAYDGCVPASADYVMFWWYKAAELVRAGAAERFGFISTNSIRQTFNRRVIENVMKADAPISIAFAIPDHPWVDSSDGADVRISMTVGVRGGPPGRLEQVVAEAPTEGEIRRVALAESRGTILADLTIGAEVAGAVPLKANSGISSPGVKLHGSGFIVTPAEAEYLGLGKDESLREIIRPYRNGRDLTQRSRDVMVIDLYGQSAEDVRSRYPSVYQWVVERVKPERDQNKRPAYRNAWWVFGEPRANLRPALKGLSRYIVTVETSKHRFFQFLDASTLPDNRLIVFALEDAYFLGALSSRIHIVWSLAAGGTLEDRPVYTKSRCFETFPFPDADDALIDRIRTLAESLDAHRRTQLAKHDRLTLTGMYNVLEKLRAEEPLTKKDREIHEKGLVSVLQDLHDELDSTVAVAYGWPLDLGEKEILERLVSLNAERAAEEAAGLVRYLRPEYQTPKGVQAELETGTEAKTAEAAERQKVAWPRELPARVQAIQSELASSAEPITLEMINERFTGGRNRMQQVEALLKTLEVLGLVQRTEDDAYVS